MAVVNCNEDSFYAPSRALREKAVEMALRAEKDGASIIDFGGESSRPFSKGISAEEELDRLIPVIEGFRARSALPVSADTRKAAVARAALDSGADIINDISALTADPEMAALCAARGAAVVLMHMKGVPLDMQAGLQPQAGLRGQASAYDDLVLELGTYLAAAAGRAAAAGIPAGKIILDPGIGFGKSVSDNLEIIRRLAEICGKDYPIMVGLSRKSFIGEITGRSQNERLPGTLAANGAAIMNGAGIIRVHDVKEHADLAKMLFAINGLQGRG
jgi:dihydropteroate synthase